MDQAGVAEDLSRGTGLVDVHRQIETLTGALQAERNAGVTFVAGNRQGDRAAVDRAQGATDTALRDTTAQLDAATADEPQLATAREQAESTLQQLPAIRAQVTGGPAPASEVTSRYTSVVQRTLGLDRAIVGRLQTADTGGLAGAVGAGANAREALELERTVINGAVSGGRLDEVQRAQVTGAEASFQAAAGDFRSSLSPEQAGTIGDLAGPGDADRNRLRDQALAGPSPSVDPAAWNGAVDRSGQAVERSTEAAEQALVDARSAAAEEAGNTAGLNSVLLMLTLLLTGGVILLLGRQMVRSLRLLRSSALEVAERKLPAAVQSMRSGQAPNALVEPVPLDSRDEIGEVARAFDAVHGQAIRLAADQAGLQQNVNSMFVNLSRRSQALVERQLQLIEQLESNEQDPDQLSNLFQLDHLATRMRRNSENLLVLAGTDLAKRNVAPVQVVDVLRAAVSEVEQYQRVVVQTPPTATIAGRAANDLVHLLAELLDNATNFSPPDSQVVMSTTRTADESLLIEISDRGVGMSDAELADANQRLSGPAEVDVSASRRMGLFVVGRLAARHHVGVRLASAAVGGGSGGLSASVTVPAQLVPSAQRPEEHLDAGPPPQAAAAAPPAPEAPEAAEGAAPVPAGAVNGAGRSGSLPSLVAGSDGPLTPTFEAGTTVTGGARNGAAAALPTRTPGSSLRKSASDAAGDAPSGQEASANGVAPGGLDAFSPSRDDDRGPADMFTPAEEAGGADERTGTGPHALQGRPGTRTGDDAPTGGDTAGGTATDAGDAPRSAGAGTAAALGLGLGFAGAAAARSGTGRPAGGEMDDTVVIDAATGDGPPPAAGDAPADRADAAGQDVTGETGEIDLPGGFADAPAEARAATTAAPDTGDAGSTGTTGSGTTADGSAGSTLPGSAEGAGATDAERGSGARAAEAGSAATGSTTTGSTATGSIAAGSTDRGDTDRPSAGTSTGTGTPASAGAGSGTAGASDATGTAGTTGSTGPSGEDAPAETGNGAATAGAAAAGAAVAGAAAVAGLGAARTADRTAERSTTDGTAEQSTTERSTTERSDAERSASGQAAAERASGGETAGSTATDRPDEARRDDAGRAGVTGGDAGRTGTEGSASTAGDTGGETGTAGSDRGDIGSSGTGTTGTGDSDTGTSSAGTSSTSGANTGGTDTGTGGAGAAGTSTSGTDGTGDHDPTTAAFPTVRPSGREPMAGPPSSRPNGARPSPGRRPVMPAGRGPSRGPGSLPTRRPGQHGPGQQGPGQQGPGQHGPGQQGLPQRVPGRNALYGPTPGGPAGAGAPDAPHGGPADQPYPARGATAPQPGAGGAAADELFAPRVPVEGDRGQLRRPGALEPARVYTGQEVEQTTPIFDDIASAWFRSNRSVPVRWQSGGPARADGPAEQPAPTARAGTATEDGRDPGFASPADEAWRQAQEVEDGDRPDELTSAGLPKRRPRARLLPGSAAGSTVLSPSPAGESRSAESVRGRLASYQQGVRQGRESAGRSRTPRTTADGTPEPSADRSNPSDPEENQ
nr:nitrate- and nitrite sensing domain-containing protein [Pseudonocardia sp. C8]